MDGDEIGLICDTHGAYCEVMFRAKKNDPSQSEDDVNTSQQVLRWTHCRTFECRGVPAYAVLSIFSVSAKGKQE